jgi:FkbM family methyltransferase
MCIQKEVLLQREFEFFSPAEGCDWALTCGRETSQEIYPIIPKDRKVTFLDIGANVGGTSILLALNFPNLNIIAIEPQPKTFICLQQNIERANLKKQIQALNIGIYSDDKPRFMIDNLADPVFHQHNSGKVKILESGCSGSCKIETKSLNQIFDQYIPYPNIIKCDVEGGEYYIFSTFKYWERIEKMHIELHYISEDEKKNVRKLNMPDNPKDLKAYLINKCGETKLFGFREF